MEPKSKMILLRQDRLLKTCMDISESILFQYEDFVFYDSYAFWYLG